MRFLIVKIGSYDRLDGEKATQAMYLSVVYNRAIAFLG